MGNLGIKGIAHVGLYVNDADKVVKFYTEKLDFQLIHECTNQCPEGPVPVKFVQNGNCVIEVVQFPFRIEKDHGYFDHISIDVDDLDAAVAELKARGVEIQEGSYTVAPHVFPPKGSKWAFITGAEGENIELNERVK